MNRNKFIKVISMFLIITFTSQQLGWAWPGFTPGVHNGLRPRAFSEGRPRAAGERGDLDALLGGLADGRYAVAILVAPNFKKSANLEHQMEVHKELCDILWHLVNNDSSETEIIRALLPLWGNMRTEDKGKLIKRLKARLSQLIKYRIVTEFGQGEGRTYSIADQFVSDLNRLRRISRREFARYLDRHFEHFRVATETSAEEQLYLHPLVAKAIKEFLSMAQAHGYIIPQEQFLVDIGMGYFYSKVRKGQKICMVLILGGSFNRNSLNVFKQAFKRGGSAMDILLSKNIPAIEIFGSRQLHLRNSESNLDTGRKVEAYFESNEPTARKKRPGRLITKPARQTPATLGKRERTTGTLQVRVLRILAESNRDLTVEEIAIELDEQEHGKWVDQKEKHFFMKNASQLNHAVAKCQEEKWVEGKRSVGKSLAKPGWKRMAYRITQNGRAHLAEKKYLEDEFIKNQI